MSYESPIKIIQIAHNQLNHEFDDEVGRVVMEVGIDVDKDELLKALAYDRDQYEKGFRDGAKAFADRLTGWTFTQERIDNILTELGVQKK